MRERQLLCHKGGGATENAVRQLKPWRTRPSRLLNDDGNAQGRPHLQPTTPYTPRTCQLGAEGTQNSVRVSTPTIGNDQHTTTSTRTTPYSRQQAVGQHTVTLRTDHTPQPQPCADHDGHAQPENHAAAFATNFVSLYMFQVQSFLFNKRLMHAFTMASGTVTPVSHGAFIQPIRLHDGLDRTAVSQQRDHDDH